MRGQSTKTEVQRQKYKDRSTKTGVQRQKYKDRSTNTEVQTQEFKVQRQEYESIRYFAAGKSGRFL
jgi:hypothetical protein